MHFHQIMTLQTANDALLCKVLPSSLAGPALSWFHHLSLNTVAPFRYLSEKFATQYMCLIKIKQSITGLFHVQMGRSKSIRDFMKCFGAAILQLDTINPDIVLQAMKQAIRPNIPSFFTRCRCNPPQLLRSCSKEETNTPC